MRWLWLVLLVPTLCFAGPESIVFESLGALVDFDSTVMSGTANEFNDGYAQVNSIRSSVFAATEGAAGDARGYGSMTGGLYTTIRFYFYMSSDFDATVAVNPLEVLDGAQTHIKFRIVADESWEVRSWDKNGVAKSAWVAMTTPSKEAWHLVEVYMHARDASIGTYCVWVYIDGVEEYKITDEMAGIVLDNFYVGLGGIDNGDAGAIYFDDIVVDTMRWTHGADYTPIKGTHRPVLSTIQDLFSGGFE